MKFLKITLKKTPLAEGGTRVRVPNINKIKKLGFKSKFYLDKGLRKIDYRDPPDFKNLPMPAWDLVDTGNYHNVSRLCVLKNEINDLGPTAIIQTLRGCVARCTFCSV